MIILTTAYDQYAVKAYDLDVKDYLLKPISFERFYKGVLRLYQSQSNGEAQEKNAAMPAPEREFIFLKVGHRIQKVGISDILLIEGMKDYLKIHTDKENILTLMSFAELEQFLPVSNFIRVHKSYMVAIDKINHIEKNRIWIGDQIVPIGETYSESFFNKLKGNA
jgi:DNA-binding LytR/AlgR family response regulator